MSREEAKAKLQRNRLRKRAKEHMGLTWIDKDQWILISKFPDAKWGGRRCFEFHAIGFRLKDVLHEFYDALMAYGGFPVRIAMQLTFEDFVKHVSHRNLVDEQVELLESGSSGHLYAYVDFRADGNIRRMWFNKPRDPEA